MAELCISLFRTKVLDELLILGTKDGLRAFAETLRSLASGARSDAVLSAGAGISCRPPLTIRAVVVPPPGTGERSPMLVRALKRALYPGPRRGLFRSGPLDSPVFEWSLDSSYWNDFAELVAGLAESGRDGNSQDLDTCYPQDASVEVEYRERLTPQEPEKQPERNSEQDDRG
jgi:hypothetical protein